MKKVLPLLIIFACLYFKPAQAQQDAYFTQYMFNKLPYNPGYAGSKEEHICATMLYHDQWGLLKNHMPDGERPPLTQAFSLHAPLKFGNTLTGLGLSIINDQQGFENTFGFNISANYKYDIAMGTISAGLSYGYLQKTLDGTKFRAYHDIQDDPLIDTRVYNDNIPFDLNAGVYFHSNQFYVGISALHITEPNLDWSPSPNYDFRRSMYIMAGYNYNYSPLLDIQPSMLIKTQGKFQFDIGAIGLYNQTFWGGLNFRSGDAISLLLGVYALPNLSIGYAYDWPLLSPVRRGGGTHEIMAGYCFQLQTKERDPNIIWTPRHLGGSR